ncbi:hypothetical protein [Microbulbifer celer]|uniref:Fibronectin type-III domain-containing protein n=1 Tax=Microbulbifer celer TaxID=435905 RepID=A0ABW3U944_9GAMM|nr:hypothetical protein [Microbulbifer celer]UFN57041.1 hypothetical protein LPW13_15965 [Microbulbifer celer]
MRESLFSRNYFPFALVAVLAGCGGGGGNSSGVGSEQVVEPPPPASEFTATPQQLRQRVAIERVPATISRENTPLLSGTFFEFYGLAQELYYTYLRKSDWGFNPLDVRNGVFDCRHGGTVELRFSAGDTVLSAFYSDCVENLPGIDGYTTLSGAERQSVLVDKSGEYLVRQEYDSYRVAVAGDSLTMDGVIEVTDSSVDLRAGDIRMDLSLSDSSGFNIRAQDLHFDLYRNDYRVYFDNAVEALSGTLAFPGGSAVVTGGVADPEDPLEIYFAGATEASASALVGGYYSDSLNVTLGFDGDGNGLRDQTLFARFDEFEGEDYGRGNFATPLARGSTLHPQNDVAQQGHNRAAFDVAPLFRDPGANLLDFTLTLVSVEEVQGEELSDARTELDEPAEYQLEQRHAGSYLLTSEIQSPLVVYRFEVTAQNGHGEASTEPQVVEVPVYRDHDDDGKPDVSDGDIDGDGVDNYLDLWPEDPEEWEDTDSDGIGNNADIDDDNDGVADVDDAQPLDFLCSIESDTNGEVCLQRILLPSSNPEYWNAIRGPEYVTYFNSRITAESWGFFLAADGVLYYWEASHGELQRWDTNTGHFLQPLELNDDYFSEGFFYADNRLVMAPSQNTGYVIYDTLRGTQGVSRFDLGGVFEESIFLEGDQITALGFENMRSLGVRDQSESALVLESIEAHTEEYVAVDLDGEVLDRHTSEIPEEYVDLGGDITFRTSALAPFCTWGMYFDGETGTFTDIGSGDPASDPCTSTFIDTGVWPSVSADGVIALTTKGIIDRNQNVVVEIPHMSPINTVWKGQELYRLTEEDQRITRFSTDGTELGYMPIPEGYRHSLLSAGEYLVYIGISIDDGHVRILRYEEQ